MYGVSNESDWLQKNPLFSDYSIQEIEEVLVARKATYLLFTRSTLTMYISSYKRYLRCKVTWFLPDSAIST